MKVITENKCEDAVQVGSFGDGSLSFRLECVGRTLEVQGDVHWDGHCLGAVPCTDQKLTLPIVPAAPAAYSTMHPVRRYITNNGNDYTDGLAERERSQRHTSINQAPSGCNACGASEKEATTVIAWSGQEITIRDANALVAPRADSNDTKWDRFDPKRLLSLWRSQWTPTCAPVRPEEILLSAVSGEDAQV